MGSLPLALGAWIASGLLVPAGLAKLRDPAPTRSALRLAGLPSSAPVVRALGVTEVTVAVAVLLVGGWAPALCLVALYTAFAVFAWSQHRDPAATCGCFGTTYAPLSRLHVAVDALLAGSSALAVPAGPSLATAASGLGIVAGGTLVVLIVTAAALLRVMLTGLPELADRLGASS